MSSPETNSRQSSPTRSSADTFSIRVEPEGRTITVNKADLPFGNDGEPGSLLDILLQHGVQIDHACGGFCSCSTCHVIVREGLETCNEASDEELDQLDNAPGLTTKSRLSCQCIPNGTKDLVIEIPEWNRNRARED